jgi:hypothetical protein
MIPSYVRRAVGWPILQGKKVLWRRFHRRLAHAREVQAERLRAIVSASAASDFGRRHALARVRTADDLRSALPIAGYEAFEPWIQRVMKGETEALFNRGTRLAMFATTSGTTAPSKYIPVTAASLAEYKESWTVWGVGLAVDHPRVPYGAVVNLASSWRSSAAPSGVPCGSISGMLFHLMHGLLRLLHAVPPAVALVDDPVRRTYLALRLALTRSDTLMLTTANPSTLVSFARSLDRWKADLMRDLADGTLRDEGAYAPEVVAAVRSELRVKHKRRARELEKAAAERGALEPRAAWPELEVLGVWTGGTLGAYLPLVRQYFGDLALRDHGLSASEGRMTVPLADGAVGGALNVAGAFYEFVPEGDYAPGTAGAGVRTLLAHELDLGGRYYLIITTSGGLFRYDLSDLVECVGKAGEAPVLRFLNKGSQIANLTGEKLSAHQAVAAVTRAATAVGLALPEWVVSPEAGDPPGYVLWLETEDHPTAEAADRLAAALDAELQRANIEYADKRQSRRLGAARVGRAASGAFAALKAERLARSGATPEQYKHPFLVVDAAFGAKVAAPGDKRRTS